MGQLLLRRNGTTEDATRLEVLFQGVKELNLPTLMDELHIQLDHPDLYVLTN